MKKCIQVFSDGSIHFSNVNLRNQKFKVYEKDERNFFLFKKKKVGPVTHSNYLLNYKNQYLI